MESGRGLDKKDDSSDTPSQGDRALELNNQAIKALNRKQYVTAKDLFDKATILAPANGTIWANYGIPLLMLGEIDEANRIYKIALELNPGLITGVQKDWNNAGITLCNAGSYNEALPYFDRAIQFNPDDPISHKNRAYALKQLGRYDEAEKEKQIYKPAEYASIVSAFIGGLIGGIIWGSGTSLSNGASHNVLEYIGFFIWLGAAGLSWKGTSWKRSPIPLLAVVASFIAVIIGSLIARMVFSILE